MLIVDSLKKNFANFKFAIFQVMASVNVTAENLCELSRF